LQSADDSLGSIFSYRKIIGIYSDLTNLKVLRWEVAKSENTEVSINKGNVSRKRSLKATWPQALWTFFIPVLLVGFIRWAVVEPFIIPSGSMLPNLQIHDHVLVKKFSYGLKFPFSDLWMTRWGMPKRGEIAVFKYPKKPSVYFIKRVIGLPGDEIIFKAGILTVNGESWKINSIDVPKGADQSFDYMEESSGPEKHIVRYREGSFNSDDEFKIKLNDNEYFMMGDNRDESMDSRYWGTLPEALLVGRAWRVIIGCDETLPSNSMLCNPATLRRDRFWLKVSE
jgi:signal peptidase I